MNDEVRLPEQVFLEAQDQLRTIRDFIRWAVSCFNAGEVFLGHGTADAYAEANALVFQSLALPWDPNPEILDAALTGSERSTIVELVRRRVNERIPLGYLLNVVYFCGLPFYVDERVLIPRSPIAELIESRFEGYLAGEPERILDLCTGSGCIAIALADAFPDAMVDATDVSLDAMAVASINIDHHDLGDRVRLVESDVFNRLPGQRYDLIVSNPPYVDAEDMADLPREYLYEPEMALAAGRDGLDIVRRILSEAADYLSDDGLLVVEVGNSQWALEQAFPEVPFEWVEFARGGSGVFVLSAAQCREFQALFESAL